MQHAPDAVPHAVSETLDFIPPRKPGRINIANRLIEDIPVQVRIAGGEGEQVFSVRGPCLGCQRASDIVAGVLTVVGLLH